ncbi:hypothetical protein C1893_23005 [Pseudomonas sp. MPR-ANC1]|uniref:defense against restriction DarA-related protein n=1 Tax=Pseudomonas sp. MPR-ANC1 TaxID=2075548 RepID=UPI000CD12C4E|nr:hypothetical protein [Pseudomonas sp. MPR-ANC1]POA45527.1 hypothetical protein C1893_23005 [Pseudomonas sp. MPR-ANC1]
MPKTNTLDFSSPAGAEKAIKQISQQMGRAGQSVVSSEFNQKPRRSSDTTYREAYLTLASGQIITLRVNGTGDIYQVLLNGSVKPLKEHSDVEKAVGEIATMAEKNQAAFQKAQARKAVALPRGMSTPKPKQVDALAQQVAELDTLITERKSTIAELVSKLGGAMTDSVPTELASLDDAARDVLTKLAKAEGQVLEDGDVPSKAGRDTLIDLGLIDRYTDKGANVLNDKGRACAAMLDSAEPELVTLPDGISWLGFKLVDQVFVDKTSASVLPSAESLAGKVRLNISLADGAPLDVVGIVVAVKFSAPKVYYSVALPVKTDADSGQTIYAVLHDLDSVFVSGINAAMMDSAEAPQTIESLEPYKGLAPDQIPKFLTLASAYVAAREIVAASGTMLDDAATAGAIAHLQVGLDVVENNGPINLAEGNVEQALHEMRMAESFRTAIAMLDSVKDRQMDDKALDQLVAIAKADAASEDEIADQDALGTLLAQSMLDVAEGIYFLTEKGRQYLNENGMDAYGEPFSE